MVFCLVPFLLHRIVRCCITAAFNSRTWLCSHFFPCTSSCRCLPRAHVLLMHDAQHTVVTAAACLLLHHAKCVIALHVQAWSSPSCHQIELEFPSTKSKNGSRSCIVAADQEARCRLGESCQELPAETGRHRWPVSTVHRTQGSGN